MEWRRFLFKEAKFLNVIIYCCFFGVFYFLLQAFFPGWFVGVIELSPHSRFTLEDEFLMSRHRIQEQGGVFVMIISMFCFAMFLIKLAFYHTKFIVNFDKSEYYSAYQKFNDKHFLQQYFIYSEKNFPIEVTRNSEIVSHDKDVVVDQGKIWRMYLSKGHFSGYINGCEAIMGHVMSKGTFKDKGKTQVVILHNALTINVILNTSLQKDFRLKLEHDRTNKWFGQLFQSSKLGPDKLIKLKDSKFEGLFKVYSNSEVDAEAYLTSERKSVLAKWKAELDRKLKVTVINNGFTVAFPNQKKLLYPKIYKKCTVEKFEENCETLAHIFSRFKSFNDNETIVEGHAV
jgi:hypothetical protein